MPTAPSPLNRLLAFRERNKFSAKAWNERGLNPSGDELCVQLTHLFDACTDDLIKAVSNHASEKQLKSTLRSSLAAFSRSDYDTEEKEFICDLFYELSTIIGIDFKDNLNQWLYGPVLGLLYKLNRILRPEKILETLRQPCTKCDTELETYIMQREKGIPAPGWYIVKCLSCEELNLIAAGADIKQIKFGNYSYIETLSADDYSEEQAQIRFDQIRYFRK